MFRLWPTYHGVIVCRKNQKKISTACILDTFYPSLEIYKKGKTAKGLNQLSTCDLANMSGEKYSDPDALSMTKDEEAGEVRFTDGTHNLIAAQDQLKRGLKSRHIQFLALGGA